uniref:Uncharacterized protein n=1 Tax=Amphimedon queenslandica TaxID=400682 RepID=A0A1X7SMF8_AMPQE
MAAEFISDPSTLFLEAFLYLPNCLTIRADKGNPVGSCSYRKKVDQIPPDKHKLMLGMKPDSILKIESGPTRL